MIRRVCAAGLLSLAMLTAGCAGPQMAPIPEPTPSSSAPGTAPPIVGVTYHPTWDQMSADKRELVLDRLQAAGVQWLRVDVSWQEFQPWNPVTRDEAAVAAFDERMTEIGSRGFKVLLMFYWAPAWATGTTQMNGRPSDPEAFGEAAAWAVTRWGADIHALEIWNEPDTQRFWETQPERTRVSDFGRLLVATSRAVREVAPELPLIAGGTSRVDVAWWKELLARPRVAESVDAIGVHPYTVPSDLSPRAPDNGKPWRVRHLRVLADVSRRYDLPVWITEYGWSTSRDDPDTVAYRRGVDERTQARYLTQGLEQFGRKPWIDAAFWYTDIDHTTGDPHQDGFGLLRVDGSPKLSYYAMQCAVSGVCGPSVSP